MASDVMPIDPAPDTEEMIRNIVAEMSGELRIRFGDRPTQTIPALWAETILRAMYARHRAMFGRLLQAAAFAGTDEPWLS